MSEVKTHRLASVAKNSTLGISTLIDHLHNKGLKICRISNTKTVRRTVQVFGLREFRSDKDVKDIARTNKYRKTPKKNLL